LISSQFDSSQAKEADQDCHALPGLGCHCCIALAIPPEAAARRERTDHMMDESPAVGTQLAFNLGGASFEGRAPRTWGSGARLSRSVLALHWNEPLNCGLAIAPRSGRQLEVLAPAVQSSGSTATFCEITIFRQRPFPTSLLFPTRNCCRSTRTTAPATHPSTCNFLATG
jgi:hypothetical protein